MLQKVYVMTLAVGMWVSASTARAACTTETFDFNDGTMQGWDTHGTYTTVNTGS